MPPFLEITLRVRNLGYRCYMGREGDPPVWSVYAGGIFRAIAEDEVPKAFRAAVATVLVAEPAGLD
jgi:hypothetical protein